MTYVVVMPRERLIELYSNNKHSCTLHPISHCFSCDHLHPTYHTFSLSLSPKSIPKLHGEVMKLPPKKVSMY